MRNNPRVIHTMKVGLAVLYMVGMIGFSWVKTYNLFVLLTPFNLLITCGALLVFQQNWSLKTGFFLFGVILIGFFTEMIGVNTRLLFGSYAYGQALGFKINHTPLLIGINWLILAYGVYVLFSEIDHRWYFPFVGASIMVVFDFVMEPVAVALKMWYWQSEQIPLKNYLDWYLVSLLIFAWLRLGRLKLENKLAVWILLIQFLFFLGLNLILTDF